MSWRWLLLLDVGTAVVKRAGAASWLRYKAGSSEWEGAVEESKSRTVFAFA